MQANASASAAGGLGSEGPRTHTSQLNWLAQSEEQARRACARRARPTELSAPDDERHEGMATHGRRGGGAAPPCRGSSAFHLHVWPWPC